MSRTSLAMAAILWLGAAVSLVGIPGDEPERILALADERVTFVGTDLSAEYTIERRSPGGASTRTVATMFRRDSADEFLIVILEPAIDKGKGYLKIGDQLWLYDPAARSFVFTSAKERFQNSSARNSDFNRSNFSGDYRPVAVREEKLGRFDCWVLDLEARNDHVSFPKVRLWISSDYLVRKSEDYSLSGQLLRVTRIPSYQKVGERWVPATIVIQDMLKSARVAGKVEYETTTISVSRPSLAPLPDSVYTKEYLERVTR